MSKVGCIFSVESCRLIITTRSLEVCRQICCQKIILVEKLREDEAWRLFNGTLGSEIKLAPQAEEIAKSVAKLCDGLPLGIITVAGSLRGDTNIHTWTNALAELKECLVEQDGMGDVEVFKVLKYSFDQLNKNHQSQRKEFNTYKLCFLYCSLYPKDYEIDREDLVKKFITEGLVDQRKSRMAQIQEGHSILDKLVDVCLLESHVTHFMYFSYRVKMHHLVRGMALKICEGKYMVRAWDKSLMEIHDEKEWTEDLEKVSFMMSGQWRWRIRDGMSPNCPKLSTLLLNMSSWMVIPDSFFSKLQGLCTLDLCRTNLVMLPDSVGDLKSLKALLLENCEKLEYVPYLGKLKALRELNLSLTAIKEVPRGLTELFNLEFLSINAPGLNMIPKGLLLKLGHLQHVNFPSFVQVAIKEIEHLERLEEFTGAVQNVNDFNCFIRSRVHDPRYRVGVGSRYFYRWRERGFGSYDNELTLCQCDLKDETVLGQGIVFLTIWRCEGLSICFGDVFSRLNNPTSLKRVMISGCEGIECVLSSEQGIGLPSYYYISTLEEIELVELEDLKGVVIQKGEIGSSVAQAVFSSLGILRIEVCNKMRNLGLTVMGVPNLEELTIFGCAELEEIFEDERRSSVTLPKLQKLSLRELPRLNNVCKAAMICNTIKEIYIANCPRLKKLRLPVLGVPNLGTITVFRCEEIEEIFEDEEIGHVTLPKLKELSLLELPRLKSVCKGKATMICKSIMKIHVMNCPRLIKKRPVHVDVPPPPTLTTIWVEREWWESLEWDNPNLPQLLQPLLSF